MKSIIESQIDPSCGPGSGHADLPLPISSGLQPRQASPRQFIRESGATIAALVTWGALSTASKATEGGSGMLVVGYITFS